MELDNREIASLVWLVIFLAWALSVPAVRTSIRPILKSLMTPTIGLPLLLMVGYVSAIVLVLHRLGLWVQSDLNDTVLWIVGFAFLSLFETPRISRDPNRLKTILLEVFSLAVFIEFIMNLYVMRLALELILVPTVTFVVLLATFAESRAEAKPVAAFLRVVQSIVGFGMLVFVVLQLSRDYSAALSVQTLKTLALPAVLSVLFVPFLYAMALYVAYDSLFRLFNARIADRRIRSYARKRTLTVCHLRLRRLSEWTRTVSIRRFETKEAIDQALQALGRGCRPAVEIQRRLG